MIAAHCVTLTGCVHSDRYVCVCMRCSGESYAGKYVPAFSYAIHEANAAHKAHLASLESSEHAHASSRHHIAQKHQAHQRAHAHAPHLRHSSRSPAPHGVPNGLTINLAGLSIGDGMMDPPTQVPGYGKYLYGLSLIDESQRDYMTAQEAKISDLMNQQQWVPAFRLFDPLMMGDEVSATQRKRARGWRCSACTVELRSQ